MLIKCTYIYIFFIDYTCKEKNIHMKLWRVQNWTLWHTITCCLSVQCNIVVMTTSFTSFCGFLRVGEPRSYPESYDNNFVKKWDFGERSENTKRWALFCLSMTTESFSPALWCSTFMHCWWAKQSGLNKEFRIQPAAQTETTVTSSQRHGCEYILSFRGKLTIFRTPTSNKL